MKLDLILDNIEEREKGTLVYIESITRIGQIGRSTAIEILTLLVREEILRPVYKIYCPDCQDSNKTIFNSINEALEDGICCNCGNDVVEEYNLNAIDFLFRKLI